MVIKGLTKIRILCVTPFCVGLCLAINVVQAQTQFEECGWLQRDERASDEPLTQQEIIELREQEIEQLVNQSEHCLNMAAGANMAAGGSNAASGAANQASGSAGGEGKAVGASAEGESGEGSQAAEESNANSASMAGAAPSNAGGDSAQSSAKSHASSNYLEEGDTSSASSVAKGTERVLPQVATANQNNSQQSTTQTEPHTPGTGIGAPRASYETADNKERLRQQLREKIAETDDPEVKKKLQERLDALK